MGSAWWQCAACLRAQEEDICELQLNHCNLYDVPPDVFIYERTLEKLYLDANRVNTIDLPLYAYSPSDEIGYMLSRFRNVTSFFYYR